MEHKEETPLKWPQGWSRTLIEARRSQGSWKRPFSFYRDAVLKAMHKFGKTKYSHGNVKIEVAPESERVRLKVKKESEAEMAV